MSLPKFTIRQMIENGVHFGHHARRWNPKMAGYIYGKKDNVHRLRTSLRKTPKDADSIMSTTAGSAAC